jgi:hypothetical protein
MTSPTLTRRSIGSSTDISPVGNRLARFAAEEPVVPDDQLVLRPCRSHLAIGVLELPPGRHTIGSAPTCDVVLEIEGVAEQHCTLLVGPRQTILKAWSPLTWINEGTVREGELQTGDRLIIGPVEFAVERILPAEQDRAERRISRLHRQLSPHHPRGPERRLGTHLSPDAERHEADAPSPLETAAERTSDRPGREDGSAGTDFLNRSRFDGRLSQDGLQSREDLRKNRETLEAERRLERREHLLRELLEDVQGLLEEFFQREREGNTKLGRQRDELDELKTALDRQAGDLLERQRHLHVESLRIEERDRELEGREEHLCELETRERELLEQQSVLDQRQLELSERATLLVRENRNIRQRSEAVHRQEQELQSRLDELEARMAEQADVEETAGKLEEERRRLELLDRTLKQREEQLADEELRLKSLRGELSEQQQHLDEEARTLARFRDSLDTEQGELSRWEGELERDQATLRQERERFSSEQADLDRRARTIERQLEELQAEQDRQEARQQELDQRETALEQRQQELERQSQDLEQRQQELAGRESRAEAIVAGAREDLKQTRADFEHQQTQTRTEFEREREELEAERVEQASFKSELESRWEELAQRAAELGRSRRELQAARDELDRRRQHLTEEQTKLEQACLGKESEAAARRANQQQELDAESSRLQAERQELEDRRQVLEDERKQLEQAREGLHTLREECRSSRTELDRQQQELERTAEELERKVEELEASRASFDQERQACDERAEELSRHAAELEEQRRMLDEERSSLESARKALATERDALKASRATAGEPDPVTLSPSHQTAPFEGEGENGQALIPERQEPEVREEPEEASLSEAVVETATSGGPPAETSDSASEDEPVVQLRSELAELFGINPSGTADASSLHKDSVEEESPPSDETRPAEQADGNQNFSPDGHPAPRGGQEERDEEETSGQSEDEFSVASYMEQLLARARKEPKEPETDSAAPMKPVAPSVSPPASVVPRKMEQAEKDNPLPDEEPKTKARKLKPDEKELLRADLDSFRNLANLSARTAVARSTCQKSRSSLRPLTIASVAGWSVSGLLFQADRWLGGPQPVLTSLAVLLSTVLTLMALHRFRSIRQSARPAQPPAGPALPHSGSRD